MNQNLPAWRLRFAMNAVAVLACLGVGADAQVRRPSSAPALGKALAAFRASPLYRLSKIRLNGAPAPNSTLKDTVDWLNRAVLANTPSNTPGVRIEARPVDISIPPHAPELESVITSMVARLRADDETWRAEIASNVMRRVNVEGKDLSALDVLRTCCTQADLQYADDDRDVVIGNVYFLRWPPVIACRVYPIAEKLVKALGEGIKDAIAPASFHDYRRDWLVLVPERNALVVFHHPDLLDALASSVEYANQNADELILRRKPAPPPGEKK